MLLFIKDADVLITAVEGTGDNLTIEDEEAGYKDYIMTNIYKRDGYEFEEKDGGQLLLTELYADLEQHEIIDKLLHYWGYYGYEYVILED